MTDYVHINAQNEVDEVGLPPVGELADGRKVSGFDKLSAAELKPLGWIPATDSGPPVYDPETHRVSSNTWVVANGNATMTYTISEIPAQELETQAEVEVRQTDAVSGIDKIAQIPNVRDKLRAVAVGTDTLTAAQLQRLVASLGLFAIRDREDT